MREQEKAPRAEEWPSGARGAADGVDSTTSEASPQFLSALALVREARRRFDAREGTEAELLDAMEAGCVASCPDLPPDIVRQMFRANPVGIQRKPGCP